MKHKPATLKARIRRAIISLIEFVIGAGMCYWVLFIFCSFVTATERGLGF